MCVANKFKSIVQENQLALSLYIYFTGKVFNWDPPVTQLNDELVANNFVFSFHK